ncbi:hypothetical protein [Telluribacter sp. SYSU D00476]|uniref:hypothetical protein n=1 Tax=Telluribacter sp. SYSU D00476 TaxID=2811430 RepID=UPI001FF65144|nr:hypothetical protein [Telluribacter sp. SYSU D00476]
MSRTTLLWLSTLLAIGVLGGSWVWYRYGPSDSRRYQYIPPELPVARTLSTTSAVCDLEVRRYKQIGSELQFELYASQSGLAPFTVEITQRGKTQRFPSMPNRMGVWLTLPTVNLASGAATVMIKSDGKPGCQTTASINYDANMAASALNPSRWIRHGSKDSWLDVRPEIRGNKLYLKDFANYNDGRTRVYLIDNIIVKDLDKGIEVKPGYLYSIVTCWIDAPYSEWWNHLRFRSIRQQNVWIANNAIATSTPQSAALRKVDIPSWFSPSRTFNVQFDTKFPEFDPIPGKFAMQYRLNADVPAQNYLKRGVTHLPRWEESTVPYARQHWTEGPSFFHDKDQAWFGSLTKQQVEEFADRITPLNVYAFDFEFWHQIYTPEVKQRLIWFARRLKERNPSLNMFDYWGGSAYHNKNFWSSSGIKPGEFVKDYQNPTANHTNFDKLPNGESLGDYMNITHVDIYPKAFFYTNEDNNTPTNYLVLSALHTSRINKKIPFQKNNKVVWFGWNRYMPLYKDPVNPWHVQTNDPNGELVVTDLITMPASQALGFSLFSLITSDGYYLWHDSQPYGRGTTNYSYDSNRGMEWYPADGRSGTETFRRKPNTPESPRYWDYPTEYFVLGNWMAKQVEDIIVGGTIQDLAYKADGQWQQPRPEQVALSAMRKDPFVTSVVKGNKIAVLAIDSFQEPHQNRQVQIRLPNGKETTIQLYGNWPSLYRGEL